MTYFTFNSSALNKASQLSRMQSSPRFVINKDEEVVRTE